MMKEILGIAAFVAMVVGIISDSRADDFAPPPYRGSPLTVQAEWDFVPPPGSFNSGWDAETEITVGGSGGEVLKTFAGRTSHIDFDLASNWTWDGATTITPTVTAGASMAANVVNWIDNEPFKAVRIQVTYSGQAPVTIGPVLAEGDNNSPGSLVQHVDVSSPNHNLHYYEDWVFTPNPDWEQIQFFVPFGTFVDQIVIDTISAPEPASLGLVMVALVGTVAMVGTRRRSN